MRIVILALAMTGLLFSAACSGKQKAEPSASGTTATASTASTSGASTSTPAAAEKANTMYGVLVARDVANNTVKINSEEIPGVMMAMTMSYELRGEKVDSAPPDGTRVQMVLHEEKGKYWVTDLKPRQ